MKKLLSKIDHVPAGQGSCIGKSWTLRNHTVTVDEVIAEGGFGVVFLARHGAQKYALKRIIVNNDHDLAVATREIQIMTSLGDHPNLLACLDYLVTPLGGGVTEVLGLMPYCRGSLLALLNAKMSAKSHLSEKEVLQILVDVVSGVARLHQCATPIIHRDLKVENVLEDEGKFVLCDFGSATPKCWDPTTHGVTATQEDLEKYTTLAYRAPEMVDLYSGRGQIGTKADIWALGVLLFKMCFYTTPFGDSILAIQSAQITFPPNSPFSLQLHALIQYLLTTEAPLRPDIYQVAELCHSLLGTSNTLTNVGGSAPPSIESLVAAMTKVVTTVKHKSEEKSIKPASITPAPVAALETSVTPRQRPKGSIVVPAPVVGAALLPPPKSPKPMDIAASTVATSSIVAAPASIPTIPPNPGASNATVTSNSNSAVINTVHATTITPTDHGHRRNVSDSSAFEKSSQPNNEIQTSSSESVISSWNPFEGDSFAAAVAGETNGGDDDPFANAPFDYFKYRPMGVDLFGAAPFSNPFLDFSPPVPQEGVTNLSFEDER